MKKLNPIIITLFIIACIGCNRTANKEKDTNTTKPNILLIVADDMGWADVGYHESPIRTSHIDQLASKGVVLEQHYVAPMCTPTRALRQGNWKLVVHRHNDADKVELFDLSTDPYEKNDLATNYQERVATMLKALVAQEKQDNDALPGDMN